MSNVLMAVCFRDKMVIVKHIHTHYRFLVVLQLSVR